MKKLVLFCVLSVLIVASAAFANSPALPEPGVYQRVNDRGAPNGRLLVFAGPGGKLYFEVRAYDYNRDMKSLTPAWKVADAPRSVFAGMIEGTISIPVAHMDFVSDTDTSEMKSWTYPVIADSVDGKFVRLDYSVKVDGDAVVLTPAGPYTSAKLGKAEVGGRYVKAALAPYIVGTPLAAYVAEQVDPNLRRRVFSKLDVAEWWVSYLSAGTHAGLGTHPAFVWLKAYDGIHDLIGTYLVAEDLSCVYVNGELVR